MTNEFVKKKSFKTKKGRNNFTTKKTFKYHKENGHWLINTYKPFKFHKGSKSKRQKSRIGG
jgi:hypothetical protein